MSLLNSKQKTDNICTDISLDADAADVTMATAASLTTEMTTCSICLDVFDNPRSLPCLHNFCLKCLQDYFKDRRPGDEIGCPMCRKTFRIPSAGLTGFQHNFIIRWMIDDKKVHGVLCAVCLKESDGSSEIIATATVYCVDCKQELCERCSRPHRRMAGGAHQLMDLGNELQRELIQLQASSCDEHKGKQLELYCHQCNENICLMCYAVQHRNHESGKIREVAETFRPMMDSDDQQIVTTISGVRQLLDHATQDKGKFFSEVESVKKTVHETGDEVKRIVDSQIGGLITELESVKSDGAKQAHPVEEQLQLALANMESFHTYSRELLDKGRPSDITRGSRDLHDRAMELLKDDFTSLNFRPPHVTFTPVDVTQLTDLNLVGKVTTGTEDQSGRLQN